MSSKEPGYSSYSLEEIRDAHRHIDERTDPERASALALELESRNEDAAREAKRDARMERRAHLTKTAVGWILVVYRDRDQHQAHG